MDLEQLVRTIPDFSGRSHADKIRFFAWYLHSYKAQETFRPADIRACYETLKLDPPGNLSQALASMESRRPRELLKSGGGFILERRVRDVLDEKYGQRPAAVLVDKLLAELPTRVPDLAERAYLDEALICFRHGAFRASVVMTWNVVFDHLCNLVLRHHLAAFNQQLPKSYPKADVQSVARRDDFAELKESQVLQVCKSANIVSGNLHKVLKEKLDRRNLAAHASGVSVLQPTAEEYIRDLVENVMLKL